MAQSHFGGGVDHGAHMQWHPKQPGQYPPPPQPMPPQPYGQMPPVGPGAQPDMKGGQGVNQYANFKTVKCKFFDQGKSLLTANTPIS